MTRRRWIADQTLGDRAALTGDHAAHLARVLRARVGQEFDVAAEGRVRRGRILSITEQRVEFELGEDVGTTFAADISLLLAIFKFDRMEWAIEKATELGVATIQPVIARRTDAHLAHAAGKRAERWRRIAHEASQQSRRLSPPEIAEPLKLKDALTPAGTRILLAESTDETTLAQAVQDAGAGPLVLAVGPEGGWTEDELAAFRAAGWTFASLGSTILRAETAAIAALAVATAFPQK